MDSAGSGIVHLQEQVAQLQRHIEAQDAEMWKLSQRVDRLQRFVDEQAEQLKALSERSRGQSMPANEKPPHY